MTTVGYGDVTPVTMAGKIVATFIMLIGVGLVALPAGMLAARFGDELPLNQYQALRDGLPGAGLQFVGDFFHELVMHKSPEELECVRKAGQMADIALQAVVERAAPGVTGGLCRLRLDRGTMGFDHGCSRLVKTTSFPERAFLSLCAHRSVAL